MRFSPISWPLLGDVLVVGKQNPLGRNAAMGIAQLCAPGSYMLKNIEENPKIEALLINKRALMFLSEEEITKFILEQIAPYSPEFTCLRVELTTSLIANSQ